MEEEWNYLTLSDGQGQAVSFSQCNLRTLRSKDDPCGEDALWPLSLVSREPLQTHATAALSLLLTHQKRGTGIDL